MVTRLTAGLAARIDGVDITRPVDEPTWADIRAAFEEHSVLVFRGQALDDTRRSRSAGASAGWRSRAA